MPPAVVAICKCLWATAQCVFKRSSSRVQDLVLLLPQTYTSLVDHHAHLWSRTILYSSLLAWCYPWRPYVALQIPTLSMSLAAVCPPSFHTCLNFLTHTRHNLAASMYSFWSKYWRWHWDKILKETLPSMLSWEMVHFTPRNVFLGVKCMEHSWFLQQKLSMLLWLPPGSPLDWIQAASPSVCHSKWFFEELVDLHF